MIIVHWCKNDYNNLIGRDPKWHVVHLLLSWIMIIFPCLMFIFHNFNSHVDCFKFNFKGPSNKVQLNSNTQVNIFVYMVDVSYGNWNLQCIVECECHQTTNNMQSCQFQLYILWPKETSNIEPFCYMQPSFFVSFLFY